MDAATLFENTMDWLRDAYGEHRFFVERDIVWTAQLRLLQEVEQANLTYRVLNDYTLFRGTRADLAILNGGAVEVAAEFKYEPSHARSGEFGPGKFPVVAWTGEGSVAKDVQRVHDYAAQGNAKTAYAVFIDEGGEFRHRDPHPGSEWRDWGNGVWALWTKAGGDAAYKAPPAGAADDPPMPAAVAIAEGGCPLTEWDMSDVPPCARLNKTLVFPGDTAHLGKQGDLLVETARWLWAKGRLTSDKLPVSSGSVRYIVSKIPFHSSGGKFESPQEIEGTPLVVETFTADRKEAVRFAIKLLKHCGVDPSGVRVR